MLAKAHQSGKGGWIPKCKSKSKKDAKKKSNSQLPKSRRF